MSYIYDQNGQEDPNQKQNIFGQPSMDSQGQTQGPGGSVQKTSTETQLSPGSSGSAQITGQPSAQDRQRVFNIQSQRQFAPKTLQALGAKMTGAKENLQSEADKYIKQYKDYDYSQGINQGTVQRGIEDSAEDFGKIRDFLGKQKQAVTEFKPQTQTEFGVDKLQSRSGIKDYYQQEFAAPQYSSSEAAYDAMLLARSPEFQKTRMALEQQQRDLGDFYKSQMADRTKEAQNLADIGLTGSQEKVRGQLSDAQMKIFRDLSEKERIEDERRRAFSNTDEQKRTIEAMAKQRAYEKLAALNNPLALRAAQRGQLGGVNIDPYVQFNLDTDWRDYASARDASQFNKIMDLLGQQKAMGDIGRLSAGQGPKEAINVNQAALDEALIQEAIQERGGLEQQYARDLKDILESKKKSAAGINERRQRGAQYYADLYKTDLGIPGAVSMDEINAAMSRPGFDINQYYTAGDKVDFRGLMTPQDQARFETLMYELGDYSPMAEFGGGAGQFGPGLNVVGEGLGREDQFRKEAFQQSLRDYIQNMRASSGYRPPNRDSGAAVSDIYKRTPLGQATSQVQYNAPTPKAPNPDDWI